MWDRCLIDGYPMMTSSNGNIFRVTDHLCGEFTGPREFPAQRPVTRSFDVFFDLRLNKRLSKQSWGWWFEPLWHPVWRHCNADGLGHLSYMLVALGEIELSKFHVARWRHQMETFSALLALCEGIHRSLVDSPRKGQWRGALVPGQTVVQTIKKPVIWDAIALIMT